MKRYYACLLGSWIDITDDGTVEDHRAPALYFEENLQYLGQSGPAECFKHDYINVQYGGKNYRIHPAMIQIVTE